MYIQGEQRKACDTIKERIAQHENFTRMFYEKSLKSCIEKCITTNVHNILNFYEKKNYQLVITSIGHHNSQHSISFTPIKLSPI